MGDRQSVEALQSLAYIGQTSDDIIHAGNGREVHLPGVTNVKVDDYSPKTKEVFEYLGCFWHGCPCIPNRHKPIGTTEEGLLTGNEETNARLEKVKNVDLAVVSIWGCEFRKLLREIPGLENELTLNPLLEELST
jgi:G:T-mismatch repair DNA endonuclease (very short patch repair protein)